MKVNAMDTTNRIWTTNGENSSNNPGVDVSNIHSTAENSSGVIKVPNHSSNLIGVQSRFRRKYYHKVVLWLLILLIFILLITVIILACIYLNSIKHTCNTKECLRAGVDLLYTMDLSVDPCEDFYKFTCGNWPSEHPKPESDTINTWFREAQSKTLRIIRDFLKSEMKKSDPNAVNKSKLMYQACMDVELMDKLSLEPLVRYLKIFKLPSIPPALNITLPVENKTEDFTFDWIASLVQIKMNLGLDMIIGFEILPDPVNKTVNRVAVGSPETESELPFNDDYSKRVLRVKRKMIAYLNEDESLDEDESKESSSTEELSAYVSYMKKVITIIVLYIYPDVNVDDFQTAASELTKDSLKISKQLIKMQTEAMNSTKSPDNISEYFIYFNITDLQKQTDKLISPNTLPIWNSYIRLIMKSNERFKVSEEMILTSERDIIYLQMVTEYLNDMSKQRLQFYIWVNVVEELVLYTTSTIRQLHADYMKMIIKTEGSNPRSMYCANGINNLMGMAVSFRLADKDFMTNSVPKVDKMLSYISEAFDDLVRSTSWMDIETKKATLQKSAEMKSFIGFPEWITNKTLLDGYYAQVNISKKTHLDNMINILAWKMRSKISAFQEVNNFEWPTSPSDVNAFHTFQSNAITIPIAMLQYPFYNLGLEALNYGAIGTILGHELTHGFDDMGRMYDLNGSMRQWWTNETIEEYVSRAQCFVEQYSNYQLPFIGEPVNGEFTLGENIADNGGLREAFYAYKKYVKKEGKENKLPGMEDYTHEQLFFISFGNLWCETLTPAASRYALEDSHCPGSIRLKGVLSNSEEFASTFKCKRGSGMFPDNIKCKIW